MVGYRTRYNGTNPVLASNRFYLTTPSDTSILFSEYEGAGAKTVKDELLKETLLEMSTKIDQEGKNPVKGYFMRLDTITGERQVSPEYFDGLTHDNEFDELLEGIKEAGHTFAGPVRLEEVYGFVLEDGRRGLLRTSPRLITNPNRVYINSPPILTISQPDQDFYNLWFMVKMQDAL